MTFLIDKINDDEKSYLTIDKEKIEHNLNTLKSLFPNDIHVDEIVNKSVNARFSYPIGEYMMTFSRNDGYNIDMIAFFNYKKYLDDSEILLTTMTLNENQQDFLRNLAELMESTGINSQVNVLFSSTSR